MRAIILMMATVGLAAIVGCGNQNNYEELAEAPQSYPRNNLYPLTAPPPGSVQPLQGYAPTRISATPYYGEPSYGYANAPTEGTSSSDAGATYAYDYSTAQYGTQYATTTATDYTGAYTAQPVAFGGTDPFAATTVASGTGNYCPPGSPYCTVEEVTRYSNPVVPIQNPPVVVNPPAATFASGQPYGTTTYGTTTYAAATTYGTPTYTTTADYTPPTTTAPVSYGTTTNEAPSYATTTYTPPVTTYTYTPPATTYTPPQTTYTQPATTRTTSSTFSSRRSASLSANTPYNRQPTPAPTYTRQPAPNPYGREPRMGRGEGTADWAIPISALGSGGYATTTTTTTTYSGSTGYAAPQYGAPAPAPTYGYEAPNYGTPAPTYGSPQPYGAPSPYGAATPLPQTYAPPLSMNSGVSLDAGPGFQSSVAGQTALNPRDFRLVPALDIPPGNHAGDAGPSQWFEVIRPGNGPVRIGRMTATCVCVGVRIPKRTYAAGERILIEARMLSKPPRNNLTYGIYVNIAEPMETVVDADVTLRY